MTLLVISKKNIDDDFTSLDSNRLYMRHRSEWTFATGTSLTDTSLYFQHRYSMRINGKFNMFACILNIIAYDTVNIRA